MPQTKTRRRLVPIPEAADYLCVNPRTVRRRIADGTITGYRFGARLVRVDLDELDRSMRVIPTGTDTTTSTSDGGGPRAA